MSAAETKNNDDVYDSDFDFDDIPDELIQKMRSDLTEKSRKLLEGKETEIKNIKSNVCKMIDYGYAVANQTGSQNEAMKKYIAKGMEINASIRGDRGSETYTVYKEVIGRINASFAMIKQPPQKVSKGCYYMVYRCITKPGLIQKSVAYMSTSSAPFKTEGGFGNNCFRIYVPIETPVLVGVLNGHFDIEGGQIYEIVLPIGTELVHIEGTTSKDYILGDYIAKAPSSTKGGNGKRKRKRKSAKKTKKNVRRTKGLNTKNKIIRSRITHTRTS